MIKLAMEVPVGVLELDRLGDLGFALAHKVLEDKKYRDWYRKSSDGREVILDNSMHELKEPLPLEDVVAAADLIEADYLIAPDRLKEPEWTLDQFLRTERHASKAGSCVEVTAVLCGRTREEREDFLDHIVGKTDMICLPYRENRLAWFREHYDEIAPCFDRIHLLGMSEFDELRMWVEIAREAPDLDISVDTSKPIKWGLARKLLSEMRADGRSLRHAPIESADLLNMSCIPIPPLSFVTDNIIYLRRICSGEIR